MFKRVGGITHLVVAPFPWSGPSVDGMLRRVMDVDRLLQGTPRIYLHPSWRKFIKLQVEGKCDGEVLVVRANLVIHFLLIKKLFRGAEVVLVHTLGLMHKVICFLPFCRAKVVLDLHGAYSDELLLERQYVRYLMALVLEPACIRRAHCVVGVTDPLLKWSAERSRRRWVDGGNVEQRRIHLPVYAEAGQRSHKLGDMGGIWYGVYAGGTQRWQCFDDVVNTILQMERVFPGEWRWGVFIPDATVPVVERQLQSVMAGSLKLGAIRHCDLLKELQRADCGFVLRDDTVVNRVACPTKLLEYLANGVVPIVKSPRIGDFLQLGYRYLTVGELLEGGAKDESFMKSARSANAFTFKRLGELYRHGSEALREELRLPALANAQSSAPNSRQ